MRAQWLLAISLLLYITVCLVKATPFEADAGLDGLSRASSPRRSEKSSAIDEEEGYDSDLGNVDERSSATSFTDGDVGLFAHGEELMEKSHADESRSEDHAKSQKKKKKKKKRAKGTTVLAEDPLAMPGLRIKHELKDILSPSDLDNADAKVRARGEAVAEKYTKPYLCEVMGMPEDTPSEELTVTYKQRSDAMNGLSCENLSIAEEDLDSLPSLLVPHAANVKKWAKTLFDREVTINRRTLRLRLLHVVAQNNAPLLPGLHEQLEEELHDISKEDLTTFCDQVSNALALLSVYDEMLAKTKTYSAVSSDPLFRRDVHALVEQILSRITSGYRDSLHDNLNVAQGIINVTRGLLLLEGITQDVPIAPFDLARSLRPMYNNTPFSRLKPEYRNVGTSVLRIVDTLRHYISAHMRISFVSRLDIDVERWILACCPSAAYLSAIQAWLPDKTRGLVVYHRIVDFAIEQRSGPQGKRDVDRETWRHGLAETLTRAMLHFLPMVRKLDRMRQTDPALRRSAYVKGMSAVDTDALYDYLRRPENQDHPINKENPKFSRLYIDQYVAACPHIASFQELLGWMEQRDPPQALWDELEAILPRKMTVKEMAALLYSGSELQSRAVMAHVINSQKEGRHPVNFVKVLNDTFMERITPFAPTPTQDPVVRADVNVYKTMLEVRKMEMKHIWQRMVAEEAEHRLAAEQALFSLFADEKAPPKQKVMKKKQPKRAPSRFLKEDNTFKITLTDVNREEALLTTIQLDEAGRSIDPLSSTEEEEEVAPLPRRRGYSFSGGVPTRRRVSSHRRGSENQPPLFTRRREAVPSYWVDDFLRSAY